MSSECDDLNSLNFFLRRYTLQSLVLFLLALFFLVSCSHVILKEHPRRNGIHNKRTSSSPPRMGLLFSDHDWRKTVDLPSAHKHKWTATVHAQFTPLLIALGLWFTRSISHAAIADFYILSVNLYCYFHFTLWFLPINDNLLPRVSPNPPTPALPEIMQVWQLSLLYLHARKVLYHWALSQPNSSP